MNVGREPTTRTLVLLHTGSLAIESGHLHPQGPGRNWVEVAGVDTSGRRVDPNDGRVGQPAEGFGLTFGDPLGRHFVHGNHMELARLVMVHL